MSKLTIALPYSGKEQTEKLSSSLAAHPLVKQVLWLCPTDVEPPAGIEVITVDSYFSGAVVNNLLAAWQSEYLLLVLPGNEIEFGARALERFVQAAEDSNVGLLYSDFRERNGDEVTDHPLIDYQKGSLRDNFDFGQVLLFRNWMVKLALTSDDPPERWALVDLDAVDEWAFGDAGPIDEWLQWGGLYDLRLRLSACSSFFRIAEPLYTRTIVDRRSSGEKIFDYVDPRQRDYQSEMERLATEHLQRLNAYLEPQFAAVPESDEQFPVTASVVIPVRNRVKTIADAVKSALAQDTRFAFNIIVVDNHSTDGTTDLLGQLAAENEKLIHLIPTRTDLGIGGCWNEAIYSAHCGRYAVQLDSDDSYASKEVLARIVAEFEYGRYAMVIGSYTIVDFELNELPPGLIDHREWTRDNGRNNALRINGLGAPRAFDVTVLRQIGLPNVSYGEDYAVALRISREYEIGRIYDSLYFARRWAGNSDSQLPLATANRYDSYKDRLRTMEILARQQFNARKHEDTDRTEF